MNEDGVIDFGNARMNEEGVTEISEEARLISLSGLERRKEALKQRVKEIDRGILGLKQDLIAVSEMSNFFGSRP